MRGNSHLIICRYGSPLDGIRSIAFLSEGLGLLFGLSLVLRKRHPFADDFARVSCSGFMLNPLL
jgi:hypothetical protein